MVGFAEFACCAADEDDVGCGFDGFGGGAQGVEVGAAEEEGAC